MPYGITWSFAEINDLHHIFGIYGQVDRCFRWIFPILKDTQLITDLSLQGNIAIIVLCIRLSMIKPSILSRSVTGWHHA